MFEFEDTRKELFERMRENKYVEGKIQRHRDVIELVYKLTQGRGFIGGGFARYVLSRDENPPMCSDIDVFCVDTSTFSALEESFKNHPNMVRRSSTQIEAKFEYRRVDGFYKESFTIQLIRPMKAGNMDSTGDCFNVLDNFDFTVSKCAILLVNDELFAIKTADFDEHDREKRLVVTKIHCPISSMKRAIKYCNKGFKIESVELLKLFDDYEKRSPEWKAIVRRGLDPESEMSEDERREFVDTMYLD